MKPFSIKNPPFSGPIPLDTDALHLSAQGVSAILQGFDHDYERYLEHCCTEEDPGRLICLYTTQTAWGNWETHPAGDELVIVLSGRARFFQELEGRAVSHEVGPREVIVNPAGTPHTADVIEPFSALYVTPGPGTFHRPR